MRLWDSRADACALKQRRTSTNPAALRDRRFRHVINSTLWDRPHVLEVEFKFPAYANRRS